MTLVLGDPRAEVQMSAIGGNGGHGGRGKFNAAFFSLSFFFFFFFLISFFKKGGCGGSGAQGYPGRDST